MVKSKGGCYMFVKLKSVGGVVNKDEGGGVGSEKNKKQKTI